MFELPIDVIHVDAALLQINLATLGRHRGSAGVVDGTSTVPGDVLILVVLLTLDVLIVWVGQLALDDAFGAGLRDLVIIHDPATAHNDQGSELAEY